MNVPQVNPAAVFAGKGGIPIDGRDPFLPIGSVVKLRITETSSQSGNNTGFSVYIRGTVVAVAQPGGGECPPPVPQSVNSMPAQVGNSYACRINGFDKQTTMNFAISDLKSFIVAALYDDGLRQESDADAENWERMMLAVASGDQRYVGREIIVETTVATNKDRTFAKIKNRFHPSAAASGS